MILSDFLKPEFRISWAGTFACCAWTAMLVMVFITRKADFTIYFICCTILISVSCFLEWAAFQIKLKIWELTKGMVE